MGTLVIKLVPPEIERVLIAANSILFQFISDITVDALMGSIILWTPGSAPDQFDAQNQPPGREPGEP
jgi:hypothetical protein